jgi:DNA-binding PadR family transcriptional regulator
VYGLALITELRRHGYALSPGTLYPVLHHLEHAGYLARLTLEAHDGAVLAAVH